MIFEPCRSIFLLIIAYIHYDGDGSAECNCCWLIDVHFHRRSCGRVSAGEVRGLFWCKVKARTPVKMPSNGSKVLQ